MDRRTALLRVGAFGAAAVAAGCGARADIVSFDRGEFALTYARIFALGQTLLATAIERNTKAGVPNTHAQKLKLFLDDLTAVGAKVEKAIIEAPQNAKNAQDIGLTQVSDLLTKALPLLTPLLGALL